MRTQTRGGVVNLFQLHGMGSSSRMQQFRKNKNGLLFCAHFALRQLILCFHQQPGFVGFSPLHVRYLAGPFGAELQQGRASDSRGIQLYSFVGCCGLCSKLFRPTHRFSSQGHWSVSQHIYSHRFLLCLIEGGEEGGYNTNNKGGYMEELLQMQNPKSLESQKWWWLGRGCHVSS